VLSYDKVRVTNWSLYNDIANKTLVYRTCKSVVRAFQHMRLLQLRYDEDRAENPSIEDLQSEFSKVMKLMAERSQADVIFSPNTADFLTTTSNCKLLRSRGFWSGMELVLLGIGQSPV